MLAPVLVCTLPHHALQDLKLTETDKQALLQRVKDHMTTAAKNKAKGLVRRAKKNE